MVEQISNNQQTSNAFLRQLPTWLQLPAWLTLVHACTSGQAARFLFAGDATQTRAHLDTLIYRKRYIGTVGPITLPRQCGPAAHQHTTVYYLTDKGLAALAVHSAELAKQARSGRPSGAHLHRLPHDLLIAEIWLWYLKEGREILEFLPENELKRRLLQRRSAADLANVSCTTLDEATGDFKIRLREPESGAEWWVEGEAAVRYAANQIAAKPKAMHWFCCDERLALLIEVTKHVRPFLLGDVRAPDNALAPVSLSKTGKPLSPRRDRAMRALAIMAGAVTATCLQAITGGRRYHNSAILKTLEAEGKLRHVDCSLRLGKDIGRPVRLYLEPSLRFQNAHDAIQRAAAAKMVVDAWRDGFDVSSYEPVTGILTLEAEDNPSIKAFSLIDNASLSIIELYQRAETLRRTSSNGHAGHVFVAMADPARIAELQRCFSTIQIHDLVRPSAPKFQPRTLPTPPHHRQRHTASVSHA